MRRSYLQAYIDLIRRRFFVIAASFILIVGSALIAALHMEKGYEASVLIDVRSESLPASASLVKTVLLGGGEGARLENISRRIKTAAFMERVLEEFERECPKGFPLLPPPDSLAERVKAQAITDTVMSISVRLKEGEGGARNAAVLANLIVKTLQDTLSAESKARSAAQLDLINSRIEEVRRRIEELRSEALRFAESEGNPTIWTAQLNHILARQEALLQERARAELGLRAAERALKAVEDQIKLMPELSETAQTISFNPLFVNQASELAKLNLEIAAAKLKYPEDSPQMRELVAKKRELEREMRSVSQTAISKTISLNPAYSELLRSKLESELSRLKYEAELQLLDERINALERELKDLLARLPEKLLRYEELSRRIEGGYELLKELMSRKIEAEIILNEGNIVTKAGPYVRKGGVMLLEPAEPNRYPVSPNLKFILIVSSVVGIIVGLGLAFSLELLDSRFRSPLSASRSLDLPLLGAVPLVKGMKTFRLEELPQELRQAAEGIAANLELGCEGEGIKSVAIISPQRGEGRTTLAVGIAVSLARMGKRVLLVDADLQNGSAHLPFRLDPSPGLAQVIAGEVPPNEAIRESGLPNLHMLPAGDKIDDPLTLLRSERIRDIFEGLKSEYGMIICDGPAITSFVPGLIMASKADSALLVVDLDMSSSDLLLQTLEQLGKAGVNLLGMVCNRVRS